MYSTERNFDHPWNRRLYDLMGARGWTKLELAQRFGYRTKGPINRMLRGTRPTINTLLILDKLEKVYEREIKEFIRQRRPYALFHRRRQREGDDFLFGRAQRPKDLKEVGNVGSVGKNGKARSGGLTKDPPTTANWTSQQWRRYKKDQAARARRSKVVGD